MTLTEWMKAEGLTMDAVAERLGTTRQAVHGWVSGRNSPRVYYACVIEALSHGAVPVESWLSPTQAMAIEGYKAKVASGGPGQGQRTGADMERNEAVE